MMYVYATGGFVLLFAGGELLVRGAVSVARRFGLSALLIGMTVVAACTSAPELVVSLDAALKGQSDISLGNVVGSNIFNVLGVLGVAALISPIVVHPKALRRDMGVMITASIALGVLAQFGTLGRVTGIVLATSLLAYIAISYLSEAKNPQLPSADLHKDEAEELEAPSAAWIGAAFLGGGLLMLVVGSRLLITGATAIAREFSVPEVVIGLTLVAIGTSLPELATSAIAAFRGHSDVAVGNAVGSNLFNIMGILGVTSIVKPIGVSPNIAQVDVWVMVATAVLLAPLLLWRGRLGRLAGFAFVVFYIAYSAVLLGGIPG